MSDISEEQLCGTIETNDFHASPPPSSVELVDVSMAMVSGCNNNIYVDGDTNRQRVAICTNQLQIPSTTPDPLQIFNPLLHPESNTWVTKMRKQKSICLKFINDAKVSYAVRLLCGVCVYKVSAAIELAS